jgi:hypothetical protein
MAHYAKILSTDNSVYFYVQEVIVANADFVSTQPGLWKQTSYNTRGGVHYGPDGLPDGGVALRGNYAGIGYTYDILNDVFYEPKPFPSWVLNESTWTWEAPVSIPVDGNSYLWNESTLSWIIVPTPTV